MHDVCVVDRLDFGIGRLSAEDLDMIELHRINVADADGVQGVIDRFAPDVIIHLAATHFIPQCETDPTGTVSTNIKGTVNLLRACPPGCRFVFASSGAVYAPADDLHSETSLIDPRDVYGLTKLHGEQFVHYFSALRGFPAVVVRLFNVVGPGETNPHLLPEIVAQMKAGYDHIRLGNIWPKRDYIHVEDAAAGFIAAGTQGTVAGGESVTVNLGTSRQYSVSEIVDRLRTVSGWHFEVVEDASRARKVDRPYLGAAIGRIERLFGWRPTRTIDDAVADLWADPDLSDGLMARYAPIDASARALA
jgi:UDP-glucose 4-epimerase